MGTHQIKAFNENIQKLDFYMMDFVTAEPCLCFEVVKENGSFGIQIVGGLDQDSAKNPFCPGDSGIFIHMIENGSPAHKAGLKVGDKILQANGNDFTMVTLRQAERRIGKKEILRVKVTRKDIQTERSGNWRISENI